MSDYEVNMMKPDDDGVATGHGNKSAQATCYALNSVYSTKEPIKGVCKRPVIWGEIMVTDKTGKHYVHSPLVYLQKPAWISETSFEKIIDSLATSLPFGFKIDHA